jgi:hypothetical protein
VKQLLFDPSHQYYPFSYEAVPDFVEEVEALGKQDISPELDVFCTALAKKVRGITFGACDHRNSCSVLDARGSPYALGWIGFANYTAVSGPKKFGVWSPRIRNYRYKYGSYQFLLSSGTVTTAVKKAATYLRPFSIPELIQFSIRTYAVRRNRHKSTTSNDEAHLLGTIQKHSSLPAQLFGVLEGDTGFTDTDLEGKVVAYKKYLDDRNAIDKLGGVKVAMVDTSTKSAVTVSTVSIDSNERFSIQGAYECSLQELPVDIAEKIAVLSLVNDDDEVYVDGAGTRIANDLYYVRYS